MQKIANTVTGRTVLPAIGTTLLTFVDVSQVVFANNTVEATVADYAAWLADPINPALRPITVTNIIGDDGTPKLLVEYTTAAVTEPLNSLISVTTITGTDAAALIAALQAWKTANPLQKIIRTTQMTGLDGSVGLMVEYGINSTITNLVNSSVFQTFFQDAGGVNTSYAAYLAWKNANPSLKPYRLTYVIATDGSCGILIEYTNSGTTPGVGQLQLSFISNAAAGTFESNLQANKTLYPGSQIFRVTAIFQGLLIESTLNGTTPVNNLVSQSAYAANPGVTDATDAYQIFKTANPTLKPIRLTAMTWGDGTNKIVAEYIS